MRIITGTGRGKRLKSLEGTDVRPTTDMVKEAMFSILQFELEGKIVADLFAGSGQLGIEAISRGAEKVHFVDNSRPSINVIKENLAAANFTVKASVHEMPAQAFLRSTSDKLDVALLDPPYERNHIQKILPALVEKMSEDGIILCEHEFGLRLPDEVGEFKLYKSYKHGKVGLTQYRRNGGGED